MDDCVSNLGMSRDSFLHRIHTAFCGSTSLLYIRCREPISQGLEAGAENRLPRLRMDGAIPPFPIHLNDLELN
jgi:hypothetical protein